LLHFQEIWLYKAEFWQEKSVVSNQLKCKHLGPTTTTTKMYANYKKTKLPENTGGPGGGPGATGGGPGATGGPGGPPTKKRKMYESQAPENAMPPVQSGIHDQRSLDRKRLRTEIEDLNRRKLELVRKWKELQVKTFFFCINKYFSNNYFKRDC
jgi:hypothetical protein